MKETEKTDIYDNDQDYARPYHWYLSPDDLCRGGIDYWQYIRIVEDLLRFLPKSTILEVGCGDGVISDYIALNYPGSKVLGIDISRKAIAFAKLMGRYAEYRHVDLFDINEQYDVVLLIEVLEHIPKASVNPFLRKIRDVLKPGGFLVLSVPTPLLPMLHPGHVQHFTTDLLVDTLREVGLEIKERVYHLDVRLSRYSRFGRSVVGLFENRVWSLKPALRLLRWLHNRCACRTTSKHAGRIVVCAVRSQ